MYVSISVVPLAFAFHLALVELPDVLGLVWPYHYARPLQLVLSEVSAVYLARVSEVVFAFPVELTVHELSCVG